jgi:antitoxin (DNA-binding transcriptional repressor) of toxin-antitoxin stability system
MTRHIAATEASRGFSHLLDQVADGEDFVVERQGRPIAHIGPVGPPTRLTWGEFLEASANWPKPDPDWAEDLRRMREEAAEWPEEDPWERYSTPRS